MLVEALVLFRLFINAIDITIPAYLLVDAFCTTSHYFVAPKFSVSDLSPGIQHFHPLISFSFIARIVFVLLVSTLLVLGIKTRKDKGFYHVRSHFEL